MGQGWAPGVAVACVMSMLFVPAAGGATDPSKCPGADVRTTPENTVQAREAVLCLLQQERTSRGLPRFAVRSSLTRAASGHARDMVRNGFFSHTSSNGRSLCDRVRSAKYLRGSKRRYHLGEALGYGWNRSSTPEVLTENLMRSRAHRRLLLKRDFRELGIALVYGLPRRDTDRPGATIVLDLGRRVANSSKSFKGAKTCVSSRKSSR
ncbi:CAP domain-containing protein [Paraconexibacter sp.]|uniref:CAP domain-containing protein n=1 Tax=Paraconexibacter sp. TaxID=2949640 RepID=UPI0035630F1A